MPYRDEPLRRRAAEAAGHLDERDPAPRLRRADRGEYAGAAPADHNDVELPRVRLPRHGRGLALRAERRSGGAHRDSTQKLFSCHVMLPFQPFQTRILYHKLHDQPTAIRLEITH